MHGGAIATAADVLGTMAVLSIDPTKPGVSIELNVSFMAAAKGKSLLSHVGNGTPFTCSCHVGGEEVRIVARVLKMGKKIAFTEIEFFSKKTGALLAISRHTKAL
jgi:acyl-coenzyme A thioesterase PaaI-like protein